MTSIVEKIWNSWNKISVSFQFPDKPEQQVEGEKISSPSLCCGKVIYYSPVKGFYIIQYR